MGNISERNLHSARFALVLLLAGIIAASLALGYAAAEKGEGKKERGNKGGEEKSQHDGQDKEKQQDNSQSQDNNDASQSNTGQQAQQQNDPPPAQPEQASSAHEQQVSESVGMQDAAYASAVAARTAQDRISTTESVATQSAARLARGMSDSLAIGESTKGAPAKTVVAVSAGSDLKVSDDIAIAGTAVPPMAPRISVTSPPLLQVSEGQDAEITFHSTSAGTFSIAIRDSGGSVVRAIKAQMQAGSNSAAWDGAGPDGKAAPAGQYSYFITAAGPGGMREPPAQGDGAIAVAWAARPASASQDASLLFAVPAAAAAIAVLLFWRRRKKSLTLYLPAEASAAIDDLRSRHPGAKVDEYVEVAGDGSVQRYSGVTINRDGMDEEWVMEEAEKAKRTAELDSVTVNYGGRTHIL